MIASRLKTLFIFIILAAVYFYLRLGWPETIEFGYDQPRIALTVMEVLEKRDFLNVVNYINSSNVAPNTITWGPFLIYFLTPFFLLSRNPIVISQMIAVFNFLGIIFTYLIGKKLFNQKVGVFAAFFMAVFPWSVIFSRMIYNPTPLLTFVPLVILLTILITKDKKNNLLLVLPSLWSIMLQLHFFSFCIVFVSFLYLLINFKSISWKKFFLGLVLSIFFWLPLIKYELNNDFRLTRGFLTALVFLQNNNQGQYQDSLIVLKHFFKVLCSNDFEFHVGYGYKDFLERLPQWLFFYERIFALVLFISFIFLILRLIFRKKNSDLFIFLWLMTVPFFIYILRLPEIVPRYFLMTLPAEALLLGLFFEKITKFILARNEFRYSKFFFNILIIIIILANGFFVIKYYNFILSYNYSQEGWMGWLSKTSDPPFSFLYKAVDFILKDAEKKKYSSLTFSDNQNVNNQFLVSTVQEYTWLYVFGKNFNSSKNSMHYFLLRGPVPANISAKQITRFGPYSVYGGER